MDLQFLYGKKNTDAMVVRLHHDSYDIIRYNQVFSAGKKFRNFLYLRSAEIFTVFDFVVQAWNFDYRFYCTLT